MNWKVEAGVRADYWFARTLGWVYSVPVQEAVPLPRPAVLRVTFDVFPVEAPTREEARTALQTFLDAAIDYNLWVLYACYEPLKERLTLELDVAMDEVPFAVITVAGGLASRHLGQAYWENVCDFAWLAPFELTALTAALEKRIPVAYISEEMPSRLPLVILVGFGIFTIGAIAAKGWKKEDWRR